MLNKLSHRGKIRVIIFSAAALAVIVIFALIAVIKANYYANSLRTNYTVAIDGLADHVQDMDESLEKCMYAGTPTMLSVTTNNLWRDSYEARELLSELPFDSEEMESTNAFLAKVAEYAKSIGVTVSSGGTVSDEDHQTLRKLKTYVSELKDTIFSIQAVYSSDDSSLDRMDISFEDPEELSKNALRALSTTTTQEVLTNVPQLIYDGPYSDGIADKEPVALSGMSTVKLSTAKKRAAKYLSCSTKDLTRMEDENGNIPCFVFSDGNKTIAISKAGGKLIYIINSAVVESSKVSVDTCLRNAENYLESIGIKNMESNYYEKIDNVLTVNFHYSQNGVKCYTDLIKVSVRMDNGTVCAVDCRAYLTNHTDSRKLETPKVNLTEAKSKVNKFLTIRNAAMAVIPTESESEKYVYEFLCTGEDKEDILVYIDTQTGMEADMLILVSNENGTLAY